MADVSRLKQLNLDGHDLYYLVHCGKYSSYDFTEFWLTEPKIRQQRIFPFIGNCI